MTGLPLLIGVTGHRDLPPESLIPLRSAVDEALTRMRKEYPHTPLILVTSLAEGGDQLCARAAMDMDIPVYALIPFAIAEFEKDFAGEALLSFRALVSACARVIVCPDIEGKGLSARQYAYRQAGIYVSVHCHALIALWDGRDAPPGGCGTREAVRFFLDQTYAGSLQSTLRAPGEGILIHIRTPRVQNPNIERPYEICISGNGARSVCAPIERFNAEKAPRGETDTLIDGVTLARAGERARTINGLYGIADALSARYRKRHIALLRALSVLCAAMVAAFLLYDEMDANLFLPVYALLMASAFLLLIASRKGRWHARFLQYRALAETLRAQFYLTLCGLPVCASDGFTWSQKYEIGWVRASVKALTVDEAPAAAAPPETVRKVWIDGQAAYHLSRCARWRKRDLRNDRMTRMFLALSVLLFLALFLLECVSPAFLGAEMRLTAVQGVFLIRDGAAFSARGLMKILMGLVTAGACFLANYYGKLSVNRQAEDYRRMAYLYERAAARLDQGIDDWQDVFTELAREEARENGQWLSYMKDNAPDISL